MECPNCGYKGQPMDTECPKCGVVYKKWEASVEKKEDEKRVKRFEKVEKKKRLIIFSVFITGVLIFLVSMLFGPCVPIEPRFLRVSGFATYSYGDQKLGSMDHRDINKWLYGKDLGWYRGSHLKPSGPIARVESIHIRIYAQADRVTVEMKYGNLFGNCFYKKCDGTVLEQIIINKIKKNK